MKQVLTLSFVPTSVDLGLLLLRLWYGIPMVWLHGWPKLVGFSKMSGGFPDPLGVGSQTSLILAILGEVVCPILLILGLFTRFAALGAAITMAVAFWGVHSLVLRGEGSGEMAFVYLGAYVALLIAGPGRFSMDGGTAAKAKVARPAKA
jgi:putative oxidoreductase